MTNKIGFIGAGNMASSLIRGLLNSGVAPGQIVAADPVAEQLAPLAGEGVGTTTNNTEVVDDCAVIVLAVKPQVLGEIVRALPLRTEQLVVCIAAGVPLASLERWSSPNQPIVRCMPNTPALLGAGVTALFANAQASPEQQERAEQILGAAGKTLWVHKESQLDAVTAVSGSGPAYFFYLMEAMIEAGQQLGLDVETAATLTIETAFGAARMAREAAVAPAELRRQVTSPGGTTERAISILDAGDARGMICSALTGAAQRSEELAREFGADDTV